MRFRGGGRFTFEVFVALVFELLGLRELFRVVDGVLVLHDHVVRAVHFDCGVGLRGGGFPHLLGV